MTSEALIQAIELADLERLQTVLKYMCRKSEVANALAEKQLLTTETTARGKKRQCPRYAVCLQCREEYDVTENDGNSCEPHPGKSGR
ncbi:hypothetical protein IWX90DRAFT_231555 [Phyllosticta citrichinensis]|uniref:Uncharacterized protein n=1 Tax=Phyllosticta citrichinensis TaxID=1130410 RepID=A0ABR1XUM1_9PEZI